MASGLQRVQAAYVKAIREGAARTLWISAYAALVELREAEPSDDPDEVYDRPGPGGDWNDHAPETPKAAFQAADDLITLYEVANGIKIAELFHVAMIAEHDEDFQWVKLKDYQSSVPSIATLRKKAEIEIEAEPETDVTPEDSFDDAEDIAYARSGDLWHWCHVTVTASYDGAVGGDSLGACSYENERAFREPGGYFDDMVNEAIGRLHEQLRNRKVAASEPGLFGHYLAMTGLGEGVSWFDDHKKFPLETPLGFEITLERYPDKAEFELSWSGRDRAPFEKSTRVGKTKSFPQ